MDRQSSRRNRWFSCWSVTVVCYRNSAGSVRSARVSRGRPSRDLRRTFYPTYAANAAANRTTCQTTIDAATRGSVAGSGGFRNIASYTSSVATSVPAKRPVVIPRAVTIPSSIPQNTSRDACDDLVVVVEHWPVPLSESTIPINRSSPIVPDVWELGDRKSDGTTTSTERKERPRLDRWVRTSGTALDYALESFPNATIALLHVVATGPPEGHLERRVLHSGRMSGAAAQSARTPRRRESGSPSSMPSATPTNHRCTLTHLPPAGRSRRNSRRFLRRCT